MSETAINNDRFPTDPYQFLLAVTACAALTLMFPTMQFQSFTQLLSIVVPLLPGRR